MSTEILNFKLDKHKDRLIEVFDRYNQALNENLQN